MATTRAVVFDLDGTLVRTDDLPLTKAGYRTPYDLLRECRAGQAFPRSFGREVDDLPGNLIASGYLTGVVTRSPKPYANTALGVAGIDFLRLSAGSDPVHSLPVIADGLGVDLEEVLFVGDTDADHSAARTLGVRYLKAPWLSGGAAVDLTADLAGSEEGHDDVELPRLPSLRWQKSGQILFGDPGHPSRRRLQSTFLEAVMAPYCAMPRRLDQPGGPFFPEIVTLAERRQGADLDVSVVMATGRLFPTKQLRPAWMNNAGAEMFACVPYEGRFGNNLSQAKDWHARQSGQRIELAGLELPSCALASAAAAFANYSSPAPILVPVPPRPFSVANPGQVSARLAYRAAELAGLECHTLLKRDGTETVCVGRVPPRRPVIVVEDQITTGESSIKAVNALIEGGVEQIVAVIAWSSSLLRGHNEPACAYQSRRLASCPVHGG